MKNLILALGLVLTAAFIFTGCKGDSEGAQETINSGTKETVKTNTPTKTKTQTKKPVSANVNTSAIEWVTFEDAQKKMKSQPKKIFADVYTYWCGPCKRMDAQTFSHPSIIKYVNKNFYAVKFNAQEEKDVVFNGNTYKNPTYDPAKGQYKRNGVNQLSLALGVRAYPTVVFLDENLNKIQSVPGYKTPEMLEPMLAYFAEDQYKSTAWDAYQQSFKSNL